MKKKYNIAFIPNNESASIVEYAHRLSSIADGYLLGEHSIPHVTLYQFQTIEADIESIWENVYNKLAQISIELTFEKFSCITFDQIVFWVSLIPNHDDTLAKMHAIVADIVRQPIKANYDPHMTLISTRDPSYENLVNRLSKIYTPVKDNFILALGKTDEIGQLTEILYSCQPKNNFSYYL